MSDMNLRLHRDVLSLFRARFCRTMVLSFISGLKRILLQSLAMKAIVAPNESATIYDDHRVNPLKQSTAASDLASESRPVPIIMSFVSVSQFPPDQTSNRLPDAATASNVDGQVVQDEGEQFQMELMPGTCVKTASFAVLTVTSNASYQAN